MRNETGNGGVFSFVDAPTEVVRIIKEIELFGTVIDKEQDITRWASLPENAVVLDLTCGSGDWGLDVASHHANMEVIGLDNLQSCVDYSRARAESQQLENISFNSIDLSQTLDFAPASFDFIHSRSLGRKVKRERWPGLLAEIYRMLRPGGTFALAGFDQIETNNRFLEKLIVAVQKKHYQAGYGFSLEGRSFGLLPVANTLFKQAGFANVKLDIYPADFSAQSPLYFPVISFISISEDTVSFKGIKDTLGDKDVATFLSHMTAESLSDTFCGLFYLYTICGTKVA